MAGTKPGHDEWAEQRALDPAFLHDDRVAGANVSQRRHRFAYRALACPPVEVEFPAIGPLRIAAGNRDCGFRGHVRHVGILAGRDDFTQDEEWPVAFDLDRDMRLANE